MYDYVCVYGQIVINGLRIVVVVLFVWGGRLRDETRRDEAEGRGDEAESGWGLRGLRRN